MINNKNLGSACGFLLFLINNFSSPRQCDTRSCRCRFAFAYSLAPCDAIGRVFFFLRRRWFGFTTIRFRRVILFFSHSWLDFRLDKTIDDDHVAEHCSRPRWRLPNTRWRMVSHSNNYVSPVTSVLYGFNHLRIIVIV